MTDKTDIAALKRPVRDRYDWSNAVWRDCDQCGKQHTGTVTAEDGSQICAHCADQLYWSAWQVLAERAIDQLEAERQRADDADSRLHEVSVHCANVEAELAAMKGEQVPVSMDVLRDTVAEMSGGLPMEWKEGNDKGHHAVPFINFNSLHRIVTKFTAQQKPVMVTRPLMDDIYHNKLSVWVDGFNYASKGYDAAIEAAGGIVSTNDERLMQDMSDIVKDGE